MKPRRILIFSLAYYPDFVGGAEVAVKEITDRISTDTVVFDMVTLVGSRNYFNQEQIGNIKVYSLVRKFGTFQKFIYPFLAYRKALKLHQENQYDAIWSIMASYAGYAGYLFKKKNLNVPFTLTIQEGDNFNRRSGILKPLFKKIFNSADRIQAISNFLANWSRSMGATCPIEVVPNAVDFENFSKSMDISRRNELRAKYGYTNEDKVVITTSRLVKKNGVDDLVTALSYLDESYKLMICGNGVERYSLMDLVVKLKLGRRVSFKDYIPHTELPDYLKISDIFARPSRTEGLGNSFLEAMAGGIPVIATPVGGIPDFLIDGENGLFCEVNNPKSIAQKIEKLAKDKESREYLIKNARKLIEEKYQWSSVAERVKEILIKS